MFGARPCRLFRDAAAKFLEENLHLASIADYATQLKQLDPYIGSLPVEKGAPGKPPALYKGTGGSRVSRPRASTSRSGVVRRILNLASRLWRDEHGLTWLDTPPLIQMLPVTDAAAAAYPLSWEEQRLLFQALPDHLARMALFKVNTGCREQEVCQLRWDWEVKVPELETSVFIVPGVRVKNREDRGLVVLNRGGDVSGGADAGDSPRTCPSATGAMRSAPSTTVAGRPRAEKAGLDQVRVHDLKHTFGRRLRAANVPLETRKVLLGHRNGDITTHYSAPELEELILAVNKVCEEKSGKSPALGNAETKNGWRLRGQPFDI